MTSEDEIRAIGMKVREPIYTLAVIFGEIRDGSEEDFYTQGVLRLMEACRTLLARDVPKVRCRGIIETERAKNVAPRSGLLNARLEAAWRERLAEWTFREFELFGPRWFDRRFINEYTPGVYADFCRYLEEALPARDRDKPQCHHPNCCLTVAIRNDLAGLNAEDARKMIMDLSTMIGGFFGFLVRDRAWGLPIPGLEDTNALRHINYLWHEYPSEYGRGTDGDMGSQVTRLYKGNVLSREHMKSARLEDLPQEDLDFACEFAPGRYYIELKDDIYRFPRYREKWGKYINLIPPGEYYFVGSPQVPLIQNFTA